MKKLFSFVHVCLPSPTVKPPKLCLALERCAANVLVLVICYGPWSGSCIDSLLQDYQLTGLHISRSTRQRLCETGTSWIHALHSIKVLMKKLFLPSPAAEPRELWLALEAALQLMFRFLQPFTGLGLAAV